MASFNPGHRDLPKSSRSKTKETVFILDIDTSMIERGLKEMKLADAVEKGEFKKIIRSELKEVKKALANKAKDVLKANGGHDPRAAYKAIKTSIYKRSLGANVSIMEPRRYVYTSNYEPPRTLKPGQRGGNRAARSERTKQLMSYYGPSRAFVLRFLNSGTDPRKAGKNGKFADADRDKIDATLWFTKTSEEEIVKAMNKIGARIIEQVVKNFNGN